MPKSGLGEEFEKRGGFFIRFITFAEMERALETAFGTGSKIIISSMAKPCGHRACKRILEGGARGEEVLKQLAELKNEENWGKISFFDLNLERGSGRIVIKDSFEVRERRSAEPCCYFFKSYLEGFLSELFKKEIRVIEVECAGSGSTQCIFIFQPKV